ncbi:ankyrin repeat domain-containing protein [Polaromonas sp. CT11-55]|uniref:ankyrin repeat domain-containing protein n=1 Tax=Polaromonas sp. CT11-55 TaxID=3243045 RepID=UPI0039A52968
MKNLLGLIYSNEAGLIEEVRSCIAQGEDVNRVTDHGESALRVASRLGRFDVVEVLLNASADRGQLKWSKTIYEVVYGTPASIRKSVEENGDLETVDHWERTPFLVAVQLGDIEKAQLLLDLGANRLATGRCGRTPMQYAVQQNNLAMLKWLVDQGFDIEATDEFMDTPLLEAASQGMVDCVKFLIECGADIHKADSIPQKPIEVAANMEVVRMLVSHGADINDISSEMHASLLGVGHDSEPEVSPDDYAAGKNRRFGTGNPEQIKNPFWLAMVRSGASAWKASEKFADASAGEREPVWCYQRFGRSTTVLDDGRIIEIAGEHEDYYDPDFCIYNDVTEFRPDGSIRIFGYPEDVFPPTDFHTATLMGDAILIVGCLGYSGGRQFGHTPVYRLSLANFEIQKIETSGDHPGWIHRHKARLDGQGRLIVSGGEIEQGLKTPALENIDEWVLDLTTWVWTRSTNRRWPQWTFARLDGKQNHLWEIRHTLWTRNANWTEKFQSDMQRLSEKLGHEPDLDAVASIYRVDGLTSDVQLKKGEDRLLKVFVDGVAIRMKEGHWCVQVMVEGELPEATLKAYKEGVLANLARLEGAAWHVGKPGGEEPMS